MLFFGHYMPSGIERTKFKLPPRRAGRVFGEQGEDANEIQRDELGLNTDLD